MSRLAKKNIVIPSGVTLSVEKETVVMKSARGEHQLKIPPGLKVVLENGTVAVRSEIKSPQIGTTWSLIRNALSGLESDFVKILEIEGVGYRAAVEGDSVVLSLGYVNPVKMKIPKGVNVVVEKNTIRIFGADKDLVHRVAAGIRAEKIPEPYKGKGIRYRGEIVRRKVGKKAGATTAAA